MGTGFKETLESIVSTISGNRDSSAVRLTEVSERILQLKIDDAPSLYRSQLQELQLALSSGKVLKGKKASSAILMLLDLKEHLLFKERNRS